MHDERDDYDDEPLKGSLAPADIVRRPGRIMLTCGVIQFVATQVFAFMARKQFSFYKYGDRTFAGFWEDVTGDGRAPYIVIGWFLVTAGCIVIVAGSRDLLRFRRYGLAFAAAVLTVLSLPWFYLCVVQVPIGLVVIQLLRRRDVRARFAAVARDSALSVNAPKE